MRALLGIVLMTGRRYSRASAQHKSKRHCIVDVLSLS